MALHLHLKYFKALGCHTSLSTLYDILLRNELESLNIDTKALQQTDHTGKVKGVIVTLKGSETNNCRDKSGKMYDFVSRYFAPWVGIPEDPVTGKQFQ